VPESRRVPETIEWITTMVEIHMENIGDSTSVHQLLGGQLVMIPPLTHKLL
jgi:hypothetical protein